MDNSQGITTYYEDISTTTSVEVTGAGPFGNVLQTLLDKAGDTSSFSVNGFLELLNTIWLIYVILAYIACILMLVLYVYASTGKKQLEELDAEARERRERIYEEHFKGLPKNNRVQDMLDHIASGSPSDWKLAIIEADIILDELLKGAGYNGSSLGERLKSITHNQLQSLDDAWEAHKVRNQVAHGGADFILTKRLAEETIKQYRRVFYELGLR